MLWLHKIISDFMDKNSDHVFHLGGTLHEAQWGASIIWYCKMRPDQNGCHLGISKTFSWMKISEFWYLFWFTIIVNTGSFINFFLPKSMWVVCCIRLEGSHFISWKIFSKLYWPLKQMITWYATWLLYKKYMMKSSNENIFRVTGLCVGNSPVTIEFPSQRPVMRSFDVFFDLHLNKWLNKQSWG